MKMNLKKCTIHIGLVLFLFCSILFCSFSPVHAAESDFVVENGVLTAYEGTDSDITIPDTVTTIGKGVFSYNQSLKKVKMPNTVTSIESNAFYYCNSLTEITFSNALTSIGDYAFSDCSSLTKVTTSNKIKTIGDSAFANCKKLKNFQLSNSLTSIGRNAFKGCVCLTKIEFPKSLTSINDYAFHSCSGLTKLTIPNNIKTIGNYAFAYCSKLKKIQFSTSLKTIGAGAFTYCTSLTEIKLPNSLKTMGSLAFANCKKLEKVTLPKSMSSLDPSVFPGCPELTLGEIVDEIPEPEQDDTPDVEDDILDEEEYDYDDYSLYDFDFKENIVVYKGVKHLYAGDFLFLYIVGRNGKKSDNYESRERENIGYLSQLSGVTYKSSNTSVATVNKSTGLIKTKKTGKTTITITYKKINRTFKMPLVVLEKDNFYQVLESYTASNKESLSSNLKNLKTTEKKAQTFIKKYGKEHTFKLNDPYAYITESNVTSFSQVNDVDISAGNCPAATVYGSYLYRPNEQHADVLEKTIHIQFERQNPFATFSKERFKVKSITGKGKKIEVTLTSKVTENMIINAMYRFSWNSVVKKTGTYSFPITVQNTSTNHKYIGTATVTKGSNKMIIKLANHTLKKGTTYQLSAHTTTYYENNPNKTYANTKTSFPTTYLGDWLEDSINGINSFKAN